MHDVIVVVLMKKLARRLANDNEGNMDKEMKRRLLIHLIRQVDSYRKALLVIDTFDNVTPGRRQELVEALADAEALIKVMSE